MTILETTSGTGLRNRHPVDELAEVRAEIGRLEAREEELRRALLAGNVDHHGVEWEAVVQDHAREHLDAKAAIEHFGKTALQPFLRRAEFQVVKLRSRADGTWQNVVSTRRNRRGQTTP
jgi:hypothetical protein